MMRGLVLLSGFCLAAAGDKTTECVFDGGKAASDLMDASIFIWAATKRCGHPGSDVVKCEIDVTSAIGSMNGVIDVILKVVDKCGSLDTENRKIGFAASVLTKAVAKLASSSGRIANACAAPPAAPVVVPAPAPASDPCAVQRRLGRPCSVQQRRLGSMPVNTAMCVVDVKGIMKHLVKAIDSLQHIKKKCEKGDQKCAHNILKVISAFGGLGEYVSGAIGDCAQADFGGKFGASSNGNANGLEKLDLAVTPACASGISGLVKSLAEVSQAAVDLSIISKKAEAKAAKGLAANKLAGPEAATVITVPVAVQVPSARLYENEGKDKDSSTSYTTFVLGGLLPVTALVSFVGGRLYAQQRPAMESVRQVVGEQE